MSGRADASPERDELIRRFRAFAEREAGASPLYQALSAAVAEDAELLDLAAHARPGQPPANMLFAAVQSLLLTSERDDPLAAFYPRLSAAPGGPGDAVPAFRSFCRRHAAEIAGLLPRRAVSTNEPARAALLRPAFALATAELDGPVHFLEIGCSAGLVLLWPRLRMDYGGGRTVGPPDAPLTLPCQLDGAAPLEIEPARIAGLQGVEREPLDPNDPSDAVWLQALVWPEQTHRAPRLERALALAGADPPRVHRGDALELLPDLAAALPDGAALVVHHQFTLNQFPENARARLESQLARIAEKRPLRRVGLEWSGRERAAVLEIAEPPQPARRLARCDPHGAWLEWAG